MNVKTFLKAIFVLSVLVGGVARAQISGPIWQDDGTTLGRAAIVNMTGAGVTCTMSGATVTCNIPGSSGTGNWIFSGNTVTVNGVRLNAAGSNSLRLDDGAGGPANLDLYTSGSTASASTISLADSTASGILAVFDTSLNVALRLRGGTSNGIGSVEWNTSGNLDTRLYRSGTSKLTLDDGNAGAAALAITGAGSSAAPLLTVNGGTAGAYSTGATNIHIQSTNSGANLNLDGNNVALNATGGTSIVVFGSGNIQMNAPQSTFTGANGLALTETSAKATCDSSLPGTLKYEVVTNVGTFYGCRQTGVGTYAWVALH